MLSRRALPPVGSRAKYSPARTWNLLNSRAVAEFEVRGLKLAMGTQVPGRGEVGEKR
jgi:hypothetical protein